MIQNLRNIHDFKYHHFILFVILILIFKPLYNVQIKEIKTTHEKKIEKRYKEQNEITIIKKTSKETLHDCKLSSVNFATQF